LTTYVVGQLPARASLAIALEGSSMAVEGDAVGLDDQTLARPEGIDLVFEHVNL